MSHEPLRALLPAIGMAAFERRRDGSFAPAAPLPPWFGRLVGDATFPFLGHILDEATQVWAARTPARREWGPCAEVDETGREFHYRVTAVNAHDAQYLVFQLDAVSDEMREVLQKVRQQMLETEQARAASDRAPAAPIASAEIVRRAVDDERAIAASLPGAATAESRQAIGGDLSARCDALARAVDALLAGR
jgi:hypothetical protein